MSTTIPQPPRLPYGPPTTGLPALPVAKTRKSTGTLQAGPPHSRVAAPALKSGLRVPSSTSQHPATPNPLTRSVSGLPHPAKTLRKTVSINSFPQPPRLDIRIASLPTGTPPASATGPAPQRKGKSGSSGSIGAPSFLNGSANGKSVSAAPAGNRTSDGLTSVSSPPHSRSSSAQGSYSTLATQYEDDSPSKSLSDTGDRRGSGSDVKGNVLVSVRVRPDTAGSGSSEGEWIVDERTSLVGYKGREGGDYHYDNVFTTRDDNARVYDCIAKRLVRRVMEGYHGTVFAYGMTGTGKTFSMQGTASSPGVIPLAITDIFSYIRETPSREFLLRVSYLEIYNEKLHDLLSMSTVGSGGTGPAEEIKLREDARRGVYAYPLKEEIVQSPTQLLRVIARGDQARRTASTQFNARSSRSHAVVQIVVESRERTAPQATDSHCKRAGLLPGGVRVSTLSLIDLAGSERAAESKERRQEGSHINKSLLTLGTVISKLSEVKDKDGKSTDVTKHLPYRDSKLTRLLQGALSGNSLVSILCTIACGSANSSASAQSQVSETLNTLKFAARAKNSIVSHARRAEELHGSDDGARVLLDRYKMEIAELKAQLEAQAQEKRRISESQERCRDEAEEQARKREAELRHEEQMLEMQLARTALKERIEHLNRLILSSKSTGVNTSGSYSSLGMYSRLSLMSARTASTPTPLSARPPCERSGSITSLSTVGRRPSALARHSGGLGEAPPCIEENELMEDLGDGTASLAAQNRALQADLADKNRYIATLEKRLLQARRASATRTSLGPGFATSKSAIMVGEDHSVSTVLREKDAEIAELRARLEDKDRMLIALRSAARSRDLAEAPDSARSSLNLSAGAKKSPVGTHYGHSATTAASLRGVGAGADRLLLSTQQKQQRPTDDEMSRMLNEMIEDRIESGHLVRGHRGSVRLPNEAVPALPPPFNAADLAPPIVPRRLSAEKQQSESSQLKIVPA